jgi:membrane dipeptidase
VGGIDQRLSAYLCLLLTCGSPASDIPRPAIAGHEDTLAPRPPDVAPSPVPPSPARAASTDVPVEIEPTLARAYAVLARVPLVDGHNDLPWTIREYAAAPGDVAAYDIGRRTPGHTDLPRLREGRVGAQFWSVYVPGDLPVEERVKVQLEQIDLARRMIEHSSQDLEWVGTADDLERVFRDGKIASLLGAEGGHTLANSLGVLRMYHALGVRYLTLTHNVHTDWADCAVLPARHGGLTGFGEEVVREMNRLGILVDLSHVSVATMEDAMRVSEGPGHLLALVGADAHRRRPQRPRRRAPSHV